MSSTSNYLAKVQKTLSKHNRTVDEFKKNPWVLAEVSKSYERYLINKYKSGNDFKWWGRSTDLYQEARLYNENYNAGSYLMGIMQADPEMWRKYQFETVADALPNPEEPTQMEIDEIFSEEMTESDEETNGNLFFIF